MSSSVSYDDDGTVQIEQQTGPGKFSKKKFHVSEIRKLEYQRPNLFSNGYIKFIFHNGSQTSNLKVPKSAKTVFDELVQVLEHEITNSKRGPVKDVGKAYVNLSVRKPPNKKSNSKKNLPLPNLENWVAVDIEWADSAVKWSVCEIGLARYVDGKLAKTWRSYIRPPGDFRVGWGEYATHGIEIELLLNAPTLAEAWSEIDEFLENDIWVLHNATQDVNRIIASLSQSGFTEIRDFNYVDTMLIARKHTWIQSASGLDALADFFKIERKFARYDGRAATSEAHGALEDAILTGSVLSSMIHSIGYTRLSTFLKVLEVYQGEVRDGQVKSGFSAPGKFKFLDSSQVPNEDTVFEEVQKMNASSIKASARLKVAEDVLSGFLEKPVWSTKKLTSGNSVCFTHLMAWDESGENHEAKVHQICGELGLDLRFGLRNDLDLLVVNDPWIYESAKLRNALSRKKPIAVTIYSEFIKHNPEFPAWNYERSDQYLFLKAEGSWPSDQ